MHLNEYTRRCSLILLYHESVCRYYAVHALISQNVIKDVPRAAFIIGCVSMLVFVLFVMRGSRNVLLGGLVFVCANLIFFVFFRLLL